MVVVGSRVGCVGGEGCSRAYLSSACRFACCSSAARCSCAFWSSRSYFSRFSRSSRSYVSCASRISRSHFSYRRHSASSSSRNLSHWRLGNGIPFSGQLPDFLGAGRQLALAMAGSTSSPNAAMIASRFTSSRKREGMRHSGADCPSPSHAERPLIVVAAACFGRIENPHPRTRTESLTPVLTPGSRPTCATSIDGDGFQCFGIINDHPLLGVELSARNDTPADPDGPNLAQARDSARDARWGLPRGCSNLTTAPSTDANATRRLARHPCVSRCVASRRCHARWHGRGAAAWRWRRVR